MGSNFKRKNERAHKAHLSSSQRLVDPFRTAVDIGIHEVPPRNTFTTTAGGIAIVVASSKN